MPENCEGRASQRMAASRYVGAGTYNSDKMKSGKILQENREDWLNYRDITDISRVHGPAGFDIGATTPDEIAISILAEAIAVLKGV
jgi:hypothetical protein